MEENPEALIGGIKERLGRLKTQSLFFKNRRGQEAYDNLILALDSAEFYLNHLAMSEVISEIEKALVIIRQ